MGRAKSVGAVKPESNGDESGEILTLAEAAAYLKMDVDGVIDAINNRGLPAREVKGGFRLARAAILAWVSRERPTWEERKPRLLELAGKYKDDPDIVGITEDAMRRRGRK